MQRYEAKIKLTSRQMTVEHPLTKKEYTVPLTDAWIYHIKFFSFKKVNEKYKPIDGLWCIFTHDELNQIQGDAL